MYSPRYTDYEKLQAENWDILETYCQTWDAWGLRINRDQQSSTEHAKLHVGQHGILFSHHALRSDLDLGKVYGGGGGGGNPLFSPFTNGQERLSECKISATGSVLSYIPTHLVHVAFSIFLLCPHIGDIVLVVPKAYLRWREKESGN